ncbi:acyl-ACP--UDP-N-acetylglucosamine O-acyltransferase [Rapidithrix thailandica]|uniref:Acyl-ACP--UDP-N-acetylglucosamine O-acyltransferase n=1 Tax=Rapidithrix thailandica TaxID=413964 RepID=A0AAW9SFY9_9BACT
MHDHRLTNIHPDAKIAENVTIEPFTTIEKNVEIGEGTWIGPNVTIMEGCRIGKNCKIYPGAVLSGVPQDLKFEGEETLTIIGDNTVIRECVTISRGTKDKFKTEVGKNCLLMAYVHIAHDCIIGDNCIFSNSVQIAGHAEIGNFVTIGGTSAVHQFAKIGSHSFISGGCLVRKDVPPYVKAAREPLSYCGVNSVGLKRRGYDNQQVDDIQEVYRIVFLRGYNNAKAIKEIEENIRPSEQKSEILDFLKKSTRGLMKGYGQ